MMELSYRAANRSKPMDGELKKEAKNKCRDDGTQV